MSVHTAIVPGISETDTRDKAVQPAPELTIVIPTFKERHNIVHIVERLRTVLAQVPGVLRDKLRAERAFEVRTADPIENNLAQPAPRAPERLMWMRAAGALPDDPALHAYLLAYVSDYSFMTTALAPHGMSWLSPALHLASIDHVMWFHRPFRCDDWLLHVINSPTAQGARGLVRGTVFTRDGRLVASTAQEGLIRPRA